MSIKLLIDGIIQQTMALVAHVSTAAGLRAPLSHVANQVFLDLVAELERQGVRRKVVADMFGLALRSYQMKVQRLSESAGDRGRSLWEAVLTYIIDEGEVGRSDLVERFQLDGADTIASILRDLRASGLVERVGSGAAARFRAVSDEDRALALGRDRTGALPALVWIAIYRFAPITEEALAEHLRVDEGDLARALEELEGDGRIERTEVDGEEVLICPLCIIPIEEPVGWEAAVFDHFQAVATAIIAKLRAGKTRSDKADVVGGSTWSMDVHPGHPHYQDALDLLKKTRAEVTALRTKVTAHNAEHGLPEEGGSKVVFYIGQNVVSDNDDDHGDET